MDFTRLCAIAKKHGAFKPQNRQTIVAPRSLATANSFPHQLGRVQRTEPLVTITSGIASHRPGTWSATRRYPRTSHFETQHVSIPTTTAKLSSSRSLPPVSLVNSRFVTSRGAKSVLKSATNTKTSILSPSTGYFSAQKRWYATEKSGTSIPEGEAKPEGTGAEVKVRTEPPGPPPLWVLYGRLSKVRLGSMVVLSTIFGYLLAPGAFDPGLFAATVLGTSFTVASANSINQYLEVEYDSMMKRTKTRPLPAGHMSPAHALTFGVTTGAVGSILLGMLVNPISAALAFSNIILYTLVYTPMKRVHPLNTAVGAIVGAIPPLIGWAAQTGGLEFGAWVAFLVMSLWQMPHFHALSWPLRFDYGGAGYRMLVNVDPNRVPAHTFLYTLASLALAPFASFTGLATPHFALLGLLPSLPWIYYAYQFYVKKSNLTARQTYKWSLYWLPLWFALLAFNLSPDRDRDPIEEDVLAIHQQSQNQENK